MVGIDLIAAGSVRDREPPAGLQETGKTRDQARAVRKMRKRIVNDDRVKRHVKPRFLNVAGEHRDPFVSRRLLPGDSGHFR